MKRFINSNMGLDLESWDEPILEENEGSIVVVHRLNSQSIGSTRNASNSEETFSSSARISRNEIKTKRLEIITAPPNGLTQGTLIQLKSASLEIGSLPTTSKRGTSTSISSAPLDNNSESSMDHTGNASTLKNPILESVIGRTRSASKHLRSARMEIIPLPPTCNTRTTSEVIAGNNDKSAKGSRNASASTKQLTKRTHESKLLKSETDSSSSVRNSRAPLTSINSTRLEAILEPSIGRTRSITKRIRSADSENIPVPLVRNTRNALSKPMNKKL